MLRARCWPMTASPTSPISEKGLAIDARTVGAALGETKPIEKGSTPNFGFCLRRRVDPGQRPVDVPLALPNGNPGFGLVDDKSAGIESGAPVLRGDSHPDGHVAQRQPPDPVDAPGAPDGEAL